MCFLAEKGKKKRSLHVWTCGLYCGNIVYIFLASIFRTTCKFIVVMRVLDTVSIRQLNIAFVLLWFKDMLNLVLFFGFKRSMSFY